MRKYIERRLTDAGILVFSEKHGTYYYICSNKEDFCKAAMKVVKDRLEENMYYDDPDDEWPGETRAKEIVAQNDNEAAYEFLDSRSDHEYEDMQIEYPEKY